MILRELETEVIFAPMSKFNLPVVWEDADGVQHTVSKVEITDDAVVLSYEG